MINKKSLSERDICTKFITPALQKAGWDLHKQILEEVFFTDGKIYVRGKLTARGERKRADYILYYQDNPIAVIEAKDNDAGLFKNEAADLMYHYLVLLKAKGFTLNDIEEILEERNTSYVRRPL